MSRFGQTLGIDFDRQFWSEIGLTLSLALSILFTRIFFPHLHEQIWRPSQIFMQLDRKPFLEGGIRPGLVSKYRNPGANCSRGQHVDSPSDLRDLSST